MSFKYRIPLSRPAKVTVIGRSLASFLKDVFKLDPNFLENEAKYKEIKNGIPGSDVDEGE
jgi:hypothetical protein